MRLYTSISNSTLHITETTHRACQRSHYQKMKHDHIPTYDLRGNGDTSGTFYRLLEQVSIIVEDYLVEHNELLLEQYSWHLTEDMKEPKRSMGEYAVEFLMIGVLGNRYQYAAQKTADVVIRLLHMLYRLRMSSILLKPCFDAVRGWISGKTVFISSRKRGICEDTYTSPDQFEKLIDWLAATGEFKDEVKRFEKWQSFFYTLSENEVQEALVAAKECALWFEAYTKSELGFFTDNINRFVERSAKKYVGREDALFCCKEPVEYHLNMVASEIMNRGFYSEFRSTDKKVVLVPGCMRLRGDNMCRAQRNGMDIICTHCSEKCSVNRITLLGLEKQFTTYIIPHSSRFTQWLERFSNDSERGVVAVACALNIVAGGYEMRELNIPSQCVMLDYCGCRKHWDDEGIPTAVNEQRILDKVTAENGL